MVRLAAVLGAITALAAFASLPSAIAAGGVPGIQIVTGVIQPVLGVSVDNSGIGSTGARDGMTVTSQQRGSLIVITIVPAG